MEQPGAAVAVRCEPTTETQPKEGNEHKTSLALMQDVLQSSKESHERNADDSVKDGSWVPKGQEGLDHSQATSAAATNVREYLKRGGTFGDDQGKDLAAALSKALQKERESLIEHRDGEAGALVYAGKNETTGEGKGIPALAHDRASGCCKKIAEAAEKLLNPATKDPKLIASILEEVKQNATDIRTALSGDKEAGKDQLDVIEEAKAIKVAAAYLAGPEVDPALRRLLYRGILTKSKLIDNELKDAPIEVLQAKHDTAALESNQALEDRIKAAMEHPSAATIREVKDGLQKLLDRERLVRKDRKDDIENEPGYIKANKEDNEINDAVIARINEILRTSNIYK